MKKYESLIKDILLFAISTFIPKAISFFLVPLYTNVLSTAEYGIADLISTTVSLLIPIFTIDISDGVMRFTIENKEDSNPLSIAVILVLKSSGLIFLILILNSILNIFSLDYQLSVFFFLNYISIAFYGILISYIRAVGRVSLIAIISAVVTSVTVISNILMLLILKMGLFGYLLSSFIGYLFADVLIFWRIKGYSLIKNNRDNKALKHSMLKYSLPLIAANISWWINSSLDRYIVTALCGVQSNGIYSIAYKIPTILQMLQSVFSQAWLLSVFREYKNDNGPQYVSNVYEMYFSAMCISCSFLILMDIPMAKFLYANEFYEAWKYVPVLLISVVFISLGGFFESLLTLQKKSKIVAITTCAGAIVNIILNFALIKIFGVMGAAIATADGYFIMWITRIKPVLKEYPFLINWRKKVILIVILILETIGLVLFQNYLICIFCVILMLVINGKILARIIQSFKKVKNDLKEE